MKNWIERYIYDVTRRLPEQERAEVSRELSANIYDMLPEEPGEEEIRRVLEELGPPSVLAEQYRQNPRYLIGPASYGDYIHVLKWLVPLVGGICLAVGLVLGGVEAFSDGSAIDWGFFVRNIFSKGISLGVAGAFNALFWATLGFVIAERAGFRTGGHGAAWSLDDLPEVSEESKGNIPLADSIVELIVSVVFTAIGLAMLTGNFPFIFLLNGTETQIYQLFSSDFLTVLYPVAIACCALQVLECAAKIAVRRWTPLVCGAVLLNNLVGVGALVYLFTRPQVFSPALLAFVESLGWNAPDALRFLGNSVERPVLLILGAIVVLSSIAECGAAIYRTAKASA